MLELVTAPASLPVSLATAREHLSIASDDTTFDATLTRFITESTTKVENYLGRSLILRKYRWWEDALPIKDGVIEIPKPPTVATDFAFEYYDADDVLRTWSSSEYQTDFISQPARIKPKSGYSFPVLGSRMHALKVTITCGYGSAESDIPGPIVGAICTFVANRYLTREDVGPGVTFGKLPSDHDVFSLIDSYRTRFFCED